MYVAANGTHILFQQIFGLLDHDQGIYICIILPVEIILQLL